jgi:hypothetical protein
MASPLIGERGIKILHVAKFVCPTSQLLKRPSKSAFKRLILTLTTPLCQHLLLAMSSNPKSMELNDSECKKGQVTQQPPIPYAVSKSSLLMMTTRETIKLKWRLQKEKASRLFSATERTGKSTVMMPDCCLQGIQPCECKGEGHRWIGNQVFRWLGLTKEWDLWKRSPKTFWGI